MDQSAQQKSTGGQVFVFDITVKVKISTAQWEEPWEVQKNKLILVFRELAKKWVFQLEQGTETGYVHFQCRVSLFEKTRDGTLATKLRQRGFDSRVSYTSGNGRRTLFSYVTKVETRLHGPWRDDSDVPAFTDDVKYIMSQGFFPWQDTIEQELQKPSTRGVDVLYDPTGALGKSTFIRYMAQRHQACILPPIKNSTTLLQDAASEQISRNTDMKGEIKIFLLDLPRGMNQEHMGQVYQAIESIKTGNLWETRYKRTFMMINPPRVFVMTNELPDMKLLSVDRWSIWTVNEKMEIENHGHNANRIAAAVRSTEENKKIRMPILIKKTEPRVYVPQPPQLPQLPQEPILIPKVEGAPTPIYAQMVQNEMAQEAAQAYKPRLPQLPIWYAK